MNEAARKNAILMIRSLALVAGLAVLALAPRNLRAQDCLTCHGDSSMTDSNGHSISVDGKHFGASIHGSLQCGNCHADDQGYPHPGQDRAGQVQDMPRRSGRGLGGSVHADSKPSIHARVATATRTTSFPRPMPARPFIRSMCRGPAAHCHSNDGMANKHGLPNVYPLYIDSIHGFALSKEGLLVAANCQSCHGSHHILSHTDPQSPTYKANIPQYLRQLPRRINADYLGGVHGKAVAAGNLKAPVCSDCHTAHAILQPTEAAFRMQSTPICGNCHKEKFSTYRDTFHSQLGSLGGYVETARCWDCHGAHECCPRPIPVRRSTRPT